MDYLGLFCLGAFVGTIATLGVRFINNVTEWQKVLAAVLPAVLSGVAISFVDRFKYSPSLGAYPLGLVAALMWAYADVGVKNLTSKQNNGIKVIGFLHLFAAGLVTIFSAVLTLVPAVEQVRAEHAISIEDRIAMLKEEKMRSLEGQADTKKEAGKDSSRLPVPKPSEGKTPENKAKDEKPPEPRK